MSIQHCRYSSNLMRLVVYGRESMAELGQLVESKFGSVVDKKLAAPYFSGNLSSLKKGVLPSAELHYSSSHPYSILISV